MVTATPFAQRPRRWDAPFSDEMSDDAVERLLGVAPFKDMRAESFPRSTPLRGLLKNDVRIRRFEKGEFIVREGDYGSSAFLIISGAARVIINLPPSVTGRGVSTRGRSPWRILAQWWGNAREDEVLRGASRSRAGGKQKRTDRIALQDIPQVLDRHRTAVLEVGAFFGEIAALSRMPRTASIIAEVEGTELIEIRWQGLRDLMKCDSRLREHIDGLYRQRLLTSLAEIPFLRHLSAGARQIVVEAAHFETHGEYDWSGEYKKLAQSGAAMAKEPVVATEGDYPNGVYMVRAGFCRVSQRHGHGHRTLNYIGAGQLFGFDELVHNWRNPSHPAALRYSLRAIGYTHLLFIPASVIERVVLPSLPADELPPPIAESRSTPSPSAEEDASTRRFFQRSQRPETKAPIEPALMEFLTENRYFNGTKAMLIDMDRCTRCDDCVRACAATHDNNPRFLRHGPMHDNIMVAQSCMHCSDPVCMIGCPTGAIHRDAFGGEVVINSATCIGCSTCANNCPYSAIRMTEVRDEAGEFLVASDGRAIAKATKCDLCIDQSGGPACVRACPHDALARVNLNTLDPLASWLRR